MADVRAKSLSVSPSMESLDSDERGPRCSCGHYQSEHDRTPYEWETSRPNTPKCGGAYLTMAADADDREGVEVRCDCDGFINSDRSWEVHHR